MDVMEKLVELIEQSGACFDCFPVVGYEKDEIEKIASHLIANSVTIQKWNHASITPKDGLYIVKLKNGKKLPARYNCGSWIMCEGYKNITNEVNEWREIE